MKIDNNHPPIKFGKTGVLIINLGTPDSTNWLDIRKYLKEFLSDRRVIEVNPIIWQLILNIFILTFRPSKTARAYKEIWMKNENMSPLLYYTQKQSEKISQLLSKENLIFQKLVWSFYDSSNDKGHLYQNIFLVCRDMRQLLHLASRIFRLFFY